MALHRPRSRTQQSRRITVDLTADDYHALYFLVQDNFTFLRCNRGSSQAHPVIFHFSTTVLQLCDYMPFPVKGPP